MYKQATDRQDSLPLISVVIVSWNAKRYVDECLSSLYSDRQVCFEVIVVDNGSSDGTPEMVCASYPQARLVRNSENLGFARANNIGIEISRGKYLFLINSDVNVPPGCLSRLLSYMEEHPEIGLLGPQMRGADGSVRRSCMRLPTVANAFCRTFAIDMLTKNASGLRSQLMLDFSHDKIADVEVLNGWFWVVRRQALDQVGLLDPRFFIYAEDLDWCHRFRKAGWRLVFYPEAYAVHYGGSSSAAAPVRFYTEMYRANLQYWNKHHTPLGVAAFILLSLIHQLLRITGYSALFLLRPASRRQALYKIRRSGALLFSMVGRPLLGRSGYAS
ncbi:MAG: glycosyltransferase family 2 protein [Acidobacteriaceae bacterium]